jgi:hypothetical protein
MANYSNNQQPQIGYNNGMNGSPTIYPYNNYMSNVPYNNYMEQPQFYRNNNQIQMPNQYLKCRPVASKEEAMAFQIDLDGSLWVFPNIPNNKIYTKQINNDGSATFSTYALSQEAENPYTSGEFVTKNEFNQVVESLMAAIHAKDN